MTQFSSLYGARLDRELGSADSTVLFNSARRKSAINEGQAEFADLTECLQRQSSITLTAGVGEYNLNAVLPGLDFLRLSREQVQFRYTDGSSIVTILAGDDLPRRDVPWLNKYVPGWQDSTVASSMSQLPSMYYIRPDGGNYFLGFWPVPSTGPGASMDALVPYIAQPTAMTSDTNEPFTVNSSVRTDLRVYHQALVHYAAAQAEKFRRDVQASQTQMQAFLNYVARYLGQMRTKGGTVITSTRQYFARRSSQSDGDPRK